MLAVTATSPTTVLLSWTPQDFGGASTLTIERSTDNGHTWTPIVTVQPATLSYTDNNLHSDTIYDYRPSPSYSSVSVHTPPLTVPDPSPSLPRARVLGSGVPVRYTSGRDSQRRWFCFYKDTTTRQYFVRFATATSEKVLQLPISSRLSVSSVAVFGVRLFAYGRNSETRTLQVAECNLDSAGLPSSVTLARNLNFGFWDGSPASNVPKQIVADGQGWNAVWLDQDNKLPQVYGFIRGTQTGLSSPVKVPIVDHLTSSVFGNSTTLAIHPTSGKLVLGRIKENEKRLALVTLLVDGGRLVWLSTVPGWVGENEGKLAPEEWPCLTSFVEGTQLYLSFQNANTVAFPVSQPGWLINKGAWLSVAECGGDSQRVSLSTIPLLFERISPFVVGKVGTSWRATGVLAPNLSTLQWGTVPLGKIQSPPILCEGTPQAFVTVQPDKQMVEWVLGS